MSPPVNLYNSPALLPSARSSINNYNSGHFRQLTFFALRSADLGSMIHHKGPAFSHDFGTILVLGPCSMDPADDPPVDPNYDESKVGNTVRSFLYSATGAFLYQKYGMPMKTYSRLDFFGWAEAVTSVSLACITAHTKQHNL
jgi:hypothetical protein